MNDEQDMVRTEAPWVDAEGRKGPKVVVIGADRGIYEVCERSG